MTIYEQTKTTIKEYLKEHYTRVIKKVKSLNYNESTKILKIFISEVIAT